MTGRCLCHCASDAFFRLDEPFNVVDVVALTARVGNVNAAIRIAGLLAATLFVLLMLAWAWRVVHEA